MNITPKECFQNNKSRKTLVSLLELTDNVKICSQVYHQISSVTTDSIWGTPVHADINCCYYVHHGQDREMFCNKKIHLVCSWMNETTFGN